MWWQIGDLVNLIYVNSSNATVSIVQSNRASSRRSTPQSLQAFFQAGSAMTQRRFFTTGSAGIKICTAWVTHTSTACHVTPPCCCYFLCHTLQRWWREHTTRRPAHTKTHEHRMFRPQLPQQRMYVL